MTKTENNRLLAWRLKLIREASLEPRSVAQTCRHFGLSRQAFYKWKTRYELHGEAGLCDRPRVPLRSPNATPTRYRCRASASDASRPIPALLSICSLEQLFGFGQPFQQLRF